MARGEIHIQLAVNFSKDPKVRALARYGRDARGCRDLYVQMLCYCKENLTDGFVPLEEVGVLVYPDSPKTGKRDADRIVEVGLAEVVEGGYRLPGFLKRNKSKAQVDAESAIKAANGRKGGKRSGQVRRSEANAKQGASSNEAETKQGASVRLNTEVIGHRSEDRDREAQRARPRSTLLGNSLLDEHLKACLGPVPRDMKQRTGEKIDLLLDDGFEANQIRAGLALMRSRPGKGPGLLSEFVLEAATVAKSPNVHPLPTGADGRPARGGQMNLPDPSEYGKGRARI